ncbi:MAG: hypothetical protein ABIX28_07555, partial [Vicinamibacterales bacterium]
MDSAEDQRQRWNGAAGHAWVESQAVLDQLFEPLADRLARPGGRAWSQSAARRWLRDGKHDGGHRA